MTRPGIAITDRQAGHRWSIAVDDELVTAAVRCDYLATRGRERWVAKVKTGQDAPRLDNPATRRQLLECQLAYDAAGVIAGCSPASPSGPRSPSRCWPDARRQ